MKRYFLDTNVILRFLMKDDPDQSPKAAGLFAAADAGECVLAVTRDVIAESEWVLRSYYKVDREAIATQLSELIRRSGLTVPDGGVLLDGLSRYRETNLDIVDCLLAAAASADGCGVATFDRGIGKRFRRCDLIGRHVGLGVAA